MDPHFWGSSQEKTLSDNHIHTRSVSLPSLRLCTQYHSTPDWLICFSFMWCRFFYYILVTNAPQGDTCFLYLPANSSIHKHGLLTVSGEYQPVQTLDCGLTCSSTLHFPKLMTFLAALCCFLIDSFVLQW